MVVYKPWITNDAISIPGTSHPFPKNPQKFLPKYDLDDDVLPEYHIKQFMNALNLMNVEHVMWSKECFHIDLKEKLQNGFSIWIQDLSLLGKKLKRHLWHSLMMKKH